MQQHTSGGGHERRRILGRAARRSPRTAHLRCRRSPGPGSAETDRDHSGGIGDQRVIALEHDHRPGPLCRPAHVRQSARARSRRCRSRAVGPARPRCGVSTVGPRSRPGRRDARPCAESRSARSGRRRRAPAELAHRSPATGRTRCGMLATSKPRSERQRRPPRRARSSTTSTARGCQRASLLGQAPGHHLERAAGREDLCSEAGTQAVA